MQVTSTTTSNLHTVFQRQLPDARLDLPGYSAWCLQLEQAAPLESLRLHVQALTRDELLHRVCTGALFSPDKHQGHKVAAIAISYARVTDSELGIGKRV